MAGPYERIPTTGPVRANDGGIYDARRKINELQAGLEDVEAQQATVRLATSFGVVADGKAAYATISSGNNTITLTGPNSPNFFDPLDREWQFAPEDQGKAIHLDQIGAVNTTWGWINATILEVYSGTSARISVAPNRPGTTVDVGLVYGTDNAAAINTALAALNDFETLFFPGSPFYYLTSGSHILEGNARRVAGFSQMTTQFIGTNPTANVWRIRKQNNRFEDFRVDYKSIFSNNYQFYLYESSLGASGDQYAVATGPTSGSGISADNPDEGPSSLVWVGAYYKRLVSNGFYRNDLRGGFGHYVEDSAFIGTIRENLRINNPWMADMSNTFIRRCEFGQYRGQLYGGSGGGSNESGGIAGILWQGGGDTLISECHFVGTYAPIKYDAVLSPGTSYPYTSNTRIIGNSFEDTWGHNIHMTTASAPTFDYAYTVIANNTLNSSGIRIDDPGASSSHSRYGNRAHARLSITGNAIQSAGVYMQGTLDATVVGNATYGPEVTSGGRNTNLRTLAGTIND